MAAPASTQGRCQKCGERFRRAHDAQMHICRPNYTPFEVGDRVVLNGLRGRIERIDAGLVEVYFPQAFRSCWVEFDRVELEEP